MDSRITDLELKYNRSCSHPWDPNSSFCHDEVVMLHLAKWKDTIHDGVAQDHEGFPYGTPRVFLLAADNAAMVLFHALRLDLGIIFPNLIYNSPVQFNKTISNITLPMLYTDPGDPTSSVLSRGPGFESYAAMARAGYIRAVDFSSHNGTHVPILTYLTQVYKLKPMPAAIAAVFIATFSMLSAVWTVFNLVAACLVKRRSPQGNYCRIYLLVGVLITDLTLLQLHTVPVHTANRAMTTQLRLAILAHHFSGLTSKGHIRSAIKNLEMKPRVGSRVGLILLRSLILTE